jgi:hypothetical protein
MVGALIEFTKDGRVKAVYMIGANDQDQAIAEHGLARYWKEADAENRDAIRACCRHGDVKSEPIAGRIEDARIYLAAQDDG